MLVVVSASFLMPSSLGGRKEDLVPPEGCLFGVWEEGQEDSLKRSRGLLECHLSLSHCAVSGHTDLKKSCPVTGEEEDMGLVPVCSAVAGRIQIRVTCKMARPPAGMGQQGAQSRAGAWLLPIM